MFRCQAASLTQHWHWHHYKTLSGMSSAVSGHKQKTKCFCVTIYRCKRRNSCDGLFVRLSCKIKHLQRCCKNVSVFYFTCNHVQKCFCRCKNLAKHFIGLVLVANYSWASVIAANHSVSLTHMRMMCWAETR